MVTVTEKAAKRLKELLAEEGKLYLRVAVQGGGCSGFQYNLMTESEKGLGDEIIESFGVKVLIDPISISYVKGSEIDYDDIKGFTVKNPQAKSTCGCGQSFEMENPPEK